jgi:hypothetical protein
MQGLKFVEALPPPDYDDLIIGLTCNVYVIDCDSEEAVRKLETEVVPSFPEDFAACPVQKTRTGNQYVFLRPAAGCDHDSATRALDWPSSSGGRMAVNIINNEVTNRVDLVYVVVDTWQQADPADTGRSISHRQPKPMSPELYAYLDEHFVGERRAEKSAPSDDPMDGSYPLLKQVQESYEQANTKRKREHPEETRPTKSARPLKDP